MARTNDAPIYCHAACCFGHSRGHWLIRSNGQVLELVCASCGKPLGGATRITGPADQDVARPPCCAAQDAQWELVYRNGRYMLECDQCGAPLSAAFTISGPPPPAVCCGCAADN